MKKKKKKNYRIKINKPSKKHHHRFFFLIVLLLLLLLLLLLFKDKVEKFNFTSCISSNFLKFCTTIYYTTKFEKSNLILLIF